MTAERLVFVDLETAETSGVWSVIQVAAVAVSSRLHELGSFEAKLPVTRAIHHSRYDETTWKREAKPLREVAMNFGEFLREHATLEMTPVRGKPYRVAQIVAHNAEFDGAMLRSWFAQMDLFFPGHFRMLCTVQRAIWLFHENVRLPLPEDYKLGTLCRYFDVPYHAEEAHDALYDVRATVELYRAMTGVIAPSFARTDRARRFGDTARTRDRRASGVEGSHRVWSARPPREPMPRRCVAPLREVGPRRP
jgi:Exonuclease